MLTITNLTSNRKFKIRNFEEDKIATLNSHPGLRYDGKARGFYIFSGNFFLKNSSDKLIESFEIKILIAEKYPNTFPIVISTDNKIERHEDYHISKDGVICLDHSYIINKLSCGEVRLYDVLDYYLPKYFSWILLKQNGITQNLEEWDHADKGTLQVYKALLDINNIDIIKEFLETYLSFRKPRRNHFCYCGSMKKLKRCHLNAANFLRATPKKTIEKDLTIIKTYD